jgi:magnesium transporter
MPSPRYLGCAFAPDAPPLLLDSLDAVESARAAGSPVWLDVEGDSGPAEPWLRERLGWHPIVFQNIRQTTARARLTPFEEYTHLAFIIPPEAGEEDGTEIDAVLGEGYLVTFHARTIALVDTLRAALPESRHTRSPDLLLCRLIAGAVESAAPRIESLDDALGVLEDEALRRPRPALLEEIVAMRDALYQLHLSLAPQQQMLRDLASGGTRFVMPYAKPFFRSAENRLRGLVDDIAIYREIAQNALELYRSSITNKTNETIRILTVVSAPLLVITFFTSLYGMNVRLPFEGHPRAFAGVMAVSATVFLGMLYWFRRRRWF